LKLISCSRKIVAIVKKKDPNTFEPF